jgi:hypothetical protein
MSLTPAEREQLQDYQQMMGADAGALALALDTLTDVMAMLGQHKVHCRLEKGPRAGEATLDLVETLRTLQTAKMLVQETMLRLRDGPEKQSAGGRPSS